jgi:hypothetical protein
MVQYIDNILIALLPILRSLVSHLIAIVIPLTFYHVD